jgi:hypothetical protein
MKLRVQSGLKLILSSAILHCGCLVAQVNVSGMVIDPDGAAVPRIGIVLKTLDGRDVRGAKTESDSTGHFSSSPREYRRLQTTSPGKIRV